MAFRPWMGRGRCWLPRKGLGQPGERHSGSTPLPSPPPGPESTPELSARAGSIVQQQAVQGMCLCVLKPRQDSQETRNLNPGPVSYGARVPGSELPFLCEFQVLVDSSQKILSVQLFFL